MIMHTHRHRENSCPFCGKKLDSSTPAAGDEPKVPKTGDFALCFGCGEWLTFEVEGDYIRLRKPTEDEYLIIGADKNMHRLRATWVKLEQRRNKK